MIFLKSFCVKIREWKWVLKAFSYEPKILSYEIIKIFFEFEIQNESLKWVYNWCLWKIDTYFSFVWDFINWNHISLLVKVYDCRTVGNWNFNLYKYNELI